jgi:hypothetical protein
MQEPGGGVDIVHDDPVRGLESLLSADVEDVASVIVSDPDVLKAVRGGLAEHLLARALCSLPGVAAVVHPEGRHQPDRTVELVDGSQVRLECKNADVAPLADGSFRLDLRRTATGDERLYRPDAFDAVACCLHSHTGVWQWRFKAAALLDRREVLSADGSLVERLDPNQRLDATWRDSLADALADAGVAGPLSTLASPDRISTSGYVIQQLPF